MSYLAVVLLLESFVRSVVKKNFWMIWSAQAYFLLKCINARFCAISEKSIPITS